MQVSLFQFGGGISNKNAIEGIVECTKLGMSVLSKITQCKHKIYSKRIFLVGTVMSLPVP